MSVQRHRLGGLLATFAGGVPGWTRQRKWEEAVIERGEGSLIGKVVFLADIIPVFKIIWKLS